MHNYTHKIIPGIAITGNKLLCLMYYVLTRDDSPGTKTGRAHLKVAGGGG
jgi:hypothetical protein